jgi:Undecaprenyl-phosphate galactose phosphotransferase WbaP
MRFFRRLLAVFIMLTFDAAGFAACYVLAYVLRLTVVTGLPAPLSFDLFVARYYLLAVYLLVFAYEGLYTRRLVVWEEVRRILRGTMLAAVLVTLALYVTGAFLISRAIVLLAMLLSFFVVPVMRTLAKQLVIALRLWSKTLVIIGTDRNADLLKLELARNWRLGYQVAATLNPSDIAGKTRTGLRDVLAQYRADSFVLSDASAGPDTAGRLLRSSATQSNEVIVLLDNSALLSLGVEAEQLESVLLMKYRYNLLQPLNIVLKRVLEVIVTLILLVILLPLFAVIALVIRLNSPGPVFFAQERIGRHGNRFRCLKFRTMWQDADQRLEKLMAADPAIQAEWHKYSRITNDPRITRPGRFLRRFSLDEFPQLWNVLRGEMSLVGPRPYMPRETDKIGAFLDVITQVRPGMTGPYQTSGRKSLTFNERLLLDEHYVKNWSFWMDLVFCLRTLGVLLSGKGAS